MFRISFVYLLLYVPYMQKKKKKKKKMNAWDVAGAAKLR